MKDIRKELMTHTGNLLMAKYEASCLSEICSDLMDRMETELNTYDENYLKDSENEQLNEQCKKLLDVRISLTRARKIKSIIDMVRKEIAKSERKENELELRLKQFCKRNNLNPEDYGLK